MRRKFLYGFVGLLGLLPAQVFASFSDVPVSHPNNRAIEFLQTVGAAQGLDGKFFPDSNVSRGEFLQMAFKGLERGTTPTIFPLMPGEPIPTISFTDVPQDNPFYPYILAASTRGAINGFGDGTFRPNDPVYTEQALKILLNLSVAFFPPEPNAMTLSFPGFDRTAWYAPYVQAGQDVGIFEANAQNVFRAMRREEVAEMIYRLRLIELTGASKFTDQLSSQVHFSWIPVTTPQDQGLAIFREALALLQSGYVKSDLLQDPEVMKGMIEGVFSALDDPYAFSFNKEDTGDFIDTLMNRSVGFGVVTMPGSFDRLEIVYVLPGSPAERAGIEEGDMITEINGQEVDEIGTDAAFFIMYSVDQVGQAMTLEIKKEGTGQLREITLVAEELMIPSVQSAVLEDNNFYFQVSQFVDTTTQEFWQQYSALSRDITPQGLIIDLRGNSGGVLDTAVTLTELFVPMGTVVGSLESNWGRKQLVTFNAPQIPNLPVMILIDGSSASAAELFAAAMGDSGRATLIGDISYGKGTAQVALSLSDGGLVYFTIAHWYRGNGATVHGIGVAPDISIIPTEDDFEHGDDPVLESAIEELNRLP